MVTKNKSLTNIESAIIGLVGDDIDSYNLHRLSPQEIETVEELLADRKQILNEESFGLRKRIWRGFGQSINGYMN